jgi:hypothetical protein
MAIPPIQRTTQYFSHRADKGIFEIVDLDDMAVQDFIIYNLAFHLSALSIICVVNPSYRQNNAL